MAGDGVGSGWEEFAQSAGQMAGVVTPLGVFVLLGFWLWLRYYPHGSLRAAIANAAGGSSVETATSRTVERTVETTDIGTRDKIHASHAAVERIEKLDSRVLEQVQQIVSSQLRVAECLERIEERQEVNAREQRDRDTRLLSATSLGARRRRAST